MDSVKEYQRELTPDTEPFDPIQLTEKTRTLVCDGSKRKYTDFYTVGVYGGISTGYTVGCNLRCYFCWVGPARDHPEGQGRFYSGKEAAERLAGNALKKGVRKARISGGEPTLCREHLLETLKHLEGYDTLDTFILETNGILFGDDETYVDELEGYELPYVRVSLKAGFAKTWEEKTGAEKDFFQLPYKAIEHLCVRDIDFHVAAMVDPRITSKEEMVNIYRKVAEISEPLADNLEWETIDMYPNTRKRLKKAGVEINVS